MLPLILDTDPGIDDAMAIAYACAHPELELLGLTTVFGNVSVSRATRNALAVLGNFGHSEVPVAQGASVPLVQKPLPHPDFVHGDDGMGNIDLEDGKVAAIAQNAAEFIVEQSLARAGELSLVAVGPLTNIALALRLDPELPSRIKQLVVMGGTLDEPGNVSPVAEANFLGDPHAADEVFSVDWPATIVGLDVTHKVLLFDSELAHLSRNSKIYGDLLYRSSRFYVNFYSTTGAAKGMPEPGCAMHDATAMVYLLRPELFTTLSGPVRVATDGAAAGQLIMKRREAPYLLNHWDELPAASACMGVNADSVKADFFDTLTSPTGTHR